MCYHKAMQAVTRIIATFCGVGYIPFIPATWASAITVVLAWFLSDSWLVYIGVLFTAAGLGVCRESRTVFRSEDPKEFVMDEVCGMILSVLWLPKSIPLSIAAFALFRILDAWKPWPISRVQNSKHPWSIMGDDLLAGLFTNLILRGVIVYAIMNR